MSAGKNAQPGSKPLYQKGGGFQPDERILYKKAFGKKKKTEADRFLAGLGFLEGEARVEAWLQAEENKY